MRHGHQRCTEAGFTLVELLVSLLLLTMTALLLLATMTSGRLVERRAAASATAGEAVAAAHGVLRDRLEAMVAEPRYGPGTPLVDMRGESDIIDFTAPPAIALRPLPPQRFRLLLSRDQRLMLYSIDPQTNVVDPDALALRGWTAMPLLADVARLDIAYFGAAPPDGQRRWRPRWSQRPSLPELVRIRVEFPTGDRRLWPDLIIRPVTTINNACLIDRNTGRCRGAS